MTDPQRWLDAPDHAPTGLAELLRASAPARGMPDAARRRGLQRVRRLASAPVAAATFWMALKSAAAAFGVGTVAMIAVEVVSPLGGPAVAPHTPPQHAGPSRVAPAQGHPPLPALRPQPDLPSLEAPSSRTVRSAQATEPLRGTPSAGAPHRDSSLARDDLAQETALLERARAALGASPDRALAMVNEHRSRFPSGRLAAERTLLEIDALLRLGRAAEARALGERFLEHAPQGLYADRVHALLDRSPR